MLFCCSAYGQILDNAEGSRWHSDATLAVASESVYRGLSLSDDRATPLARLQVNHQSGLFASFWATRVDLMGLFFIPGPREWQLAYDLGYSWQFHRDWGISGSHTWFQYTDSNSVGYKDYDYEEWTAAIHYSDYTTLVYASADELWGFDLQQDTLSLVLRYPFSSRIVGEIELGEVEYTGFVDSEYQFARINLGYVHKQLSAQLQYHYSSSEAQQLYRKDRVGSQWVVEVAYHFTLL